jgi:hypothetical protein
MVYAHMEKTAGDHVTVTSLRSVFDYLRDINIRPLNDLGEVLTAVVDAIRSGAFARWTSNGDKTLTLDFNDGGKTAMLFALPLTRTGIFMSFADPESCDERGPSVSRVVRLDERLLQDIANALGPLPNAAPPPALLPLPYQALAIPPPPS